MALSAPPTGFGGIFRQSLVSLAVDLGGLLAGAIVASNLNLVQMAPWTIMLYPAIISMRGTVGGIFTGHFSTGLHLGSMKPRLLGNTDDFNDLIVSLLALNLIGGAFLWLVAVFALTAMGEQSLPMLTMLIGTTGLGFIAIVPLSTGIITMGYKRGLDPDISSYPIESTVADVVVTVCYILLLYVYAILGQAGLVAIAIFDFVYIAAAIALCVSRRKHTAYVTIVKQSTVALIVSSVLVNITGVLLINLSEAIERVRIIYMVYPSIIDTVGDVGAIVGSILTTRLALGELRASLGNLWRMLPEIGGIWLASAVMFQVYGLISWLIFGELNINILFRLSLVLFSTGTVASLAIAVVAFCTGILTYTKGLNPDCFVIPIESSLADSLSTFSLLVSILTYGLS